jgi:hypothetical protein
VGTTGRGVGTRKGGMKVNIVDVFVSIYGNRRMKPVEIVLKRGEWERKRTTEGVNLKIYCKHICKYHNISPCTTIIC